MMEFFELDVLPVAFNAVFFCSSSCYVVLTVRILGLVFTGSY